MTPANEPVVHGRVSSASGFEPCLGQTLSDEDLAELARSELARLDADAPPAVLAQFESLLRCASSTG